MKVRNYRELIAWQKAMDLAEKVYIATAGFPKEELYGLTSQLRRAAVSIPSNIAEGQGRRTTNEFLHFLSVANGSRCEVETQLILSQRLRFLRDSDFAATMDLAAEVGRLQNGLCNSLNRL